MSIQLHQIKCDSSHNNGPPDITTPNMSQQHNYIHWYMEAQMYACLITLRILVSHSTTT